MAVAVLVIFAVLGRDGVAFAGRFDGPRHSAGHQHEAAELAPWIDAAAEDSTRLLRLRQLPRPPTAANA